MEFIRLKSVLFVLCLGFLSCTSSSQEQEQEQKEIKVEYQVLSVEKFKESLDLDKEVQLVDVRTKGEFDGGSIPNAMNYDIMDGTFEKSLEKLDKNKPVYVFCAKGGRSAKASKMLEEKGFTKIVDLEGGYTAWSMYENQ